MEKTTNNQNLKENCIQSDNQYKQYTIAVLGASGVGKTFFWASYFNSVINLGQSRNIPTLTGDSKYISEIIKTIFSDHEKVMGTEKTPDISFKLDSKKMDINLISLSGCPIKELSYEKEDVILSALKKADGIMIFISAEDIVKNKIDKLLDDNFAFIRVMPAFRSCLQGQRIKKVDIPVWFIFTKGDKVEQDTDYLMKKIMIASKSYNEKINSSDDELFVCLYDKGDNVKGFKVSAVGVKWDDEVRDAKVPENAKQSNIVKALDEFFDAVSKTRQENDNTLDYIPTLEGLKIIPDLLSGILYFIKEALKIVLKEDDKGKFEEFTNNIGNRFIPIIKRIWKNCKIGDNFTLIDLFFAALGLDPLRRYTHKNYEKLRNNPIFARLEKEDKLTSLELLFASLVGESSVNILEKIVNFRTLFRDMIKTILRTED